MMTFITDTIDNIIPVTNGINLSNFCYYGK